MKVAHACHRGVWSVKNTRPVVVIESDNAFPVKLIHSRGVVLVLSASATLAQY